MLKNYLAIAFRNLKKHTGYTFINIFGLAVGIAGCLLILLYVQDELSYDRFHEKSDRIYRIIELIGEDGVGERSASVPFPVAETLRNEYPDAVEDAVRFFNFQAPALAMAYEAADRRFNERRVFFTDSTVFRVFDFSLRQGDPATALAEPGTVVLTEAMAHKYFGDEEPIGKVLTFEEAHDLRVTGIMDELPANAHFQADFLASMATLNGVYPNGIPATWYWNPCWTYVLLAEGVRPETLEAQLPAFVQEYFPDVIKHESLLRLQPLSEIHLRSKLDYEIRPNSSAANVYIFSAVAFFILLIACFNFMNLSTARSAKRAREVGMRKVLGARRTQLIGQFLGESTLLSALAVVFALAFTQAALPLFNQWSGKAMQLNLLDNGVLAGGLVVIVLVVGLLSGLYPAFVLSAFRPVRVLKGGPNRQAGGWGFRRVLVVTQFAISILLIVGTATAYQQLRYLMEAELGFDDEQVVMLPVSRSPLAPDFETFRDEVLRHAGVLSVTALEEVLGAKYQAANYQFEGMAESRLFARLNVRHDFARTFGIELAAGRAYDEAYGSDEEEALLVNEALVRYMGWASAEEAVGKPFVYDGEPAGQIIGVVKDFNFASLHNPIAPLVMDLNLRPQAFNLFIKYAAVRLGPGDPSEALAHLEGVWNQFVPNRAFEYFFLDDNLTDLYRAENNLGKVAGVFALLAMLVACLGLFGLASFMAEQRTKEIGVRKVLGASVSAIVLLLSKDFVRLVLVAFLVAAPIAYLGLSRWLEGFAYRVEFGFGVLALAGVVALLIAWGTVSYQSVKAALTDPVKSLRYE